MSVSERVAGEARAASMRSWPFVTVDRRAFLAFAAVTLGVLVLRLPSLFEPPWHTDEGIFAAVATRVLQGGDLYADAWESKPPLFLYLYVAITSAFGPGVLPLHIAATAAAIAGQLALYAVGLRLTLSRPQALMASAVLGVLLAVPFWEGTLALTEIFALLPGSLAVLCVLVAYEASPRRSTSALLLCAGLLFGVAFLLRQTTLLIAAAAVLWLMLSGRPWLRPSLLLGTGVVFVVVPVVGAFAVFGRFDWFWDANVEFFFSYVPSGQELPFHYRPLIVAPVLVAIGALLAYRRRGETPRWSLPLLWFVLTLAAALLTGRPYSHYFLLTFPPLALIVALAAPYARFSWRPAREQRPALLVAASLLVLWFAVVTPSFGWNVLGKRYSKGEHYYANFAGWALGLRSDEAYNRYFDKRANLTLRLEETLERLGARGERVYIWGEYPWVYALAGAQPATRYTTSFYVLLIPNLDVQLFDELAAADPRFILLMGDVWPRVSDPTGVTKWRYDNASRSVNRLIAWRYEQVARVGRARIFERTDERPFVADATPSAAR